MQVSSQKRGGAQSGSRLVFQGESRGKGVRWTFTLWESSESGQNEGVEKREKHRVDANLHLRQKQWRRVLGGS